MALDLAMDVGYGSWQLPTISQFPHIKGNGLQKVQEASVGGHWSGEEVSLGYCPLD